MKLKYSLIITFLLCFLYGCKGDRKEEDIRTQLMGRWQIYDATRNQKPTTTLKDGFMTFLESDTLVTNILGDTTHSPFAIKEQTLESYGDFNFQFKINQLSGDSLILSGRMRVFDMVFYLVKDKDDKL